MNFIKLVIGDYSALSLVVSNLLTICWAAREHSNFLTILIIYWSQSVVIGFFSFIKILSLKNFSTVGVKFNNQLLEPTVFTKIFSAFFFLFHYGIFHFVYAVFLLVDRNISSVNFGFVLPSFFIFFGNHLFSFIQNWTKESKTKNLGTLMFFPYLRIFPMHLAIIFGGIFAGVLPVILFMFLKSIADVTMHVFEHRGRPAL